MAQFKDAFWGFEGFEELRKYIKGGSDFSRTIHTVLHERAELENMYSRGLQKIATKLNKAAGTVLGTTGAVWQRIADVMKDEASHHKDLSTSLEDDVVKEMKNICDNHTKKRKTIECPVNKMGKLFNDSCHEEQKCKKRSLNANKEFEHLDQQLSDSRLNKIKGLTLKDIAKLETKRRKWEEVSSRADMDYLSACVKRERWRQQWGMRLSAASSLLQDLERERLERMQDLAQKYTNHLTLLGPKTVQSCENLTEAIGFLDPEGDLQTVSEIKGQGPAVAEQVLPDFFAEDSNNGMKKDRRKEALQRYLQNIKHDMEAEQQSLRDTQARITACQNTSNSSENPSVQNALHQVQAMVNYFEACHFKVQCALADVENCNRPTNHLSAYLEQHRNKQGVQSVLRIPAWVEANQQNGSNGEIPGEAIPPTVAPDLGQCRALYAYEATAGDELTLRPGDIVTLQRKSSDWWQGELNGRVGLFPASYVQEIT